MNENKNEQEPENDKKYSGGLSFFMFLGGIVVIMIIAKLLMDKLMN